MIKGYPDVPVAKGKQDLFDIGIYIDSLADFINSCNTPMTIAIQGDWGSGKTSMMNMVRERLGDDVIPVWFNTWQYSQFDMSANLPVSLLTYLTERIGDEQSRKSMAKAVLKILKGTALLASRVIVENIAGGAAASAFDSSSEEIVNYAKAIDEMKQQFRETVEKKLLKEQKNRIVIFVDDLDRLSPEVAVELLEVLKLFVDVENCVYVLAVDYEVVSQGIRKKFGDVVTKEKGKSFFDKIIQLPFRMPVGLYNLDKYITSTLNDFGIKAVGKELENYKELITSSIGQNPRSMKRLFNSFQLIKTIAIKQNGAQPIKAETERILFAILCMQMAYEDLYDYLLSNRRLFFEPDFFVVNDPQHLGLRLYKDLAEPDLRAITPMFNFYQVFHDSIQLDEDRTLSVVEIENLKDIFSFSAITSNSSNVVEQGAQDSTNRYLCRGVAKALIDILGHKHNNVFSVYQASNKPEAYVYISPEINGISCGLDIMVKIEDGGYVCEVYVFNRHKTNKREFEKAGDSLFTGLKYRLIPGDGTRSYFVFLEKTLLDIPKDTTLSYKDIAERYYGQLSGVVTQLLERLYK